MLEMDTEEEMIAAVLHDVVEDSDVTLDELAWEGFGENVLVRWRC
jgi:(p)ppGpp synthase/HD superfamily hydrolase